MMSNGEQRSDRQSTALNSTNRRMVILTDGYSNPLTAKTACCVLRYCGDEVVAVLDREAAGKTAE